MYGPVVSRSWTRRWRRRYGIQLADRGLDLCGDAAVQGLPRGLPPPSPDVAEYLSRCGIVLPGLPRIPVCADTLIDVDSDPEVAPTELDSDSDGDIILVPVAARVTWAVPEFVIIFIASVGKCKRLPAGRERVMRGRRTLQDFPPPDEDSEDERSGDDPSLSEAAAEEWLREQLY